MDVLVFRGCVSKGVGHHNELGIPGRSQLGAVVPNDWPEKLRPGSLNIELPKGGVPQAFQQHGLPVSVESLDTGLFQPEFEIMQGQIAGNTIGRERGPRGGDAQVWRAFLFADGRPLDTPQCWVLRRFGSRVGQRLELVAASRLRDAPGIVDGLVVTVRMQGHWKVP
jgi:hypothetical protein